VVVRFHVNFQMIRPGEGTLTLCTAETLVTSVQFNVTITGTFVFEESLTVLTLEGSVTSGGLE